MNVENFHSYFMQAFTFRKSCIFKGFEITVVIILTSIIRFIKLVDSGDFIDWGYISLFHRFLCGIFPFYNYIVSIGIRETISTRIPLFFLKWVISLLASNCCMWHLPLPPQFFGDCLKEKSSFIVEFSSRFGCFSVVWHLEWGQTRKKD